MVPKLKLLARMILPVLSLGASLAALDGSVRSPAGSVPAAIVAFVAFCWWKEIGPQSGALS